MGTVVAVMRRRCRLCRLLVLPPLPPSSPPSLGFPQSWEDLLHVQRLPPSQFVHHHALLIYHYVHCSSRIALGTTSTVAARTELRGPPRAARRAECQTFDPESEAAARCSSGLPIRSARLCHPWHLQRSRLPGGGREDKHRTGSVRVEGAPIGKGGVFSSQR